MWTGYKIIFFTDELKVPCASRCGGFFQYTQYGLLGFANVGISDVMVLYSPWIHQAGGAMQGCTEKFGGGGGIRSNPPSFRLPLIGI